MLRYGGQIDVDNAREFRLNTHCGIAWLGQFNDEEWKIIAEADAGPSGVPAEWIPFADSLVDEEIVLRLELSPDNRIMARPADAPAELAIDYRPTTEPHPGCD